MQDPTNSRTCTNYRVLEDKRGWSPTVRKASFPSRIAAKDSPRFIFVNMVKQIQESRIKKRSVKLREVPFSKNN